MLIELPKNWKKTLIVILIIIMILLFLHTIYILWKTYSYDHNKLLKRESVLNREPFTDNIPYISGRYVKILGNPDTEGIITIAGVFIYGNDGNIIAKDKTKATMNTTLDPIFSAGNAIILPSNVFQTRTALEATTAYELFNSGKDSTVYNGFSRFQNVRNSPLCIANSKGREIGDKSTSDWWMYDLGTDTEISAIEIIPRIDCCYELNKNLTIQILNSDKKIVSSQDKLNAVFINNYISVPILTTWSNFPSAKVKTITIYGNPTDKFINIAGVFIYNNFGINIIPQEIGSATMNSIYSDVDNSINKKLVAAFNALNVSKLIAPNRKLVNATNDLINYNTNKNIYYNIEKNGYFGVLTNDLSQAYISHSAGNGSNPDTWTYTFNTDIDIAAIEIFPRMDCCINRNKGLTVEFKDSNGNGIQIYNLSVGDIYIDNSGIKSSLPILAFANKELNVNKTEFKILSTTSPSPSPSSTLSPIITQSSVMKPVPSPSSTLSPIITQSSVMEPVPFPSLSPTLSPIITQSPIIKQSSVMEPVPSPTSSLVMTSSSNMIPSVIETSNETQPSVNNVVEPESTYANCSMAGMIGGIKACNKMDDCYYTDNACYDSKQLDFISNNNYSCNLIPYDENKYNLDCNLGSNKNYIFNSVSFTDKCGSDDSECNLIIQNATREQGKNYEYTSKNTLLHYYNGIFPKQLIINNSDINKPIPTSGQLYFVDVNDKRAQIPYNITPEISKSSTIQYLSVDTTNKNNAQQNIIETSKSIDKIMQKI